jgi:hypothetical protein
MGERDNAMIQRRGFLRILVTSGMTAITAAAPLAGCAVSDATRADEKNKPRFRETEEVKTFYRVNSYPT